MFNILLLWLLLIPVTLSIVSFVLLPNINSRIDYKDSLKFAAIGLLISASIIAGFFYLGKGVKTHDTEIWNGQITGKDRNHGSYTRVYQCMCVTDSKGNQTCQTCTEAHYTVEWVAYSTIGGYTIDSADWTSPGVYLLPDPAFYVNIRIGEPCSKSNSYTNYIKAVPESLFRPISTDLKSKFAKMIPEYPINLYNYWHVDRVLPIGINLPNINEWNSKLSETLKNLGPQKQANAIILLVNSNDPNYTYALQDAWVNGKKNDIIVIIGATNYPQKADWVSILALTDNEMFKVKLRDDILALETLTADNVISALTKDTSELFKRKRMRDFKYLDAEIDPPNWIIYCTIIFVIGAYLGFWYYARNKL